MVSAYPTVWSKQAHRGSRVHEGVVVVREEMAVAIEHDRDAGVTSSHSDLFGVSTIGESRVASRRCSPP